MTRCALCGQSGGDLLCYAMSDWICPNCCACYQRRVFPLQRITLGPEGPRFRKEKSPGVEVSPFSSRTCPHFCPHVVAEGVVKETG